MQLEEKMHIARKRGVPLYQQIARFFRKELANGHLQQLDRLPSSRQVANAIGVHYNTVLKAYKELKADDIAVTRERAGTWIEQIFDDMRPDAILRYHRYDIRAALRYFLALGGTQTQLYEWLYDIVEADVMRPIRSHPNERVRWILKNARKRRAH
jgi:GntR family transcriptional regulator